MALYILVKRKGSKSYLGAIPVKKGVSKVQLRKRLAKGKKAGLQYRIVTGSQVKSLLSTLIKKKVSTTKKRRKPLKRAVNRKKRVVRRKKKR